MLGREACLVIRDELRAGGGEEQLRDSVVELAGCGVLLSTLLSSVLDQAPRDLRRGIDVLHGSCDGVSAHLSCCSLRHMHGYSKVRTQERSGQVSVKRLHRVARVSEW